MKTDNPQLAAQIRARKMKAVRRAPYSMQFGSRTQLECKQCDPLFGGLGWCKRHSPYHTIAHMGFWRWLWVWIVKSGKMIVVSVLPKIIKVVVLMVFAFVLTIIINSGLQKQELVTCQKLAQQAQTHAPFFYLTKIEKSMCDDLGVIIQAPVK